MRGLEVGWTTNGRLLAVEDMVLRSASLLAFFSSFLLLSWLRMKMGMAKSPMVAVQRMEWTI